MITTPRFNRLVQLSILIAVWWRWYVAYQNSIKLDVQEARLEVLEAWQRSQEVQHA